MKAAQQSSYTGVQPKFTNRIKASQIKYVCDVKSSKFGDLGTPSALKDFDDVWSGEYSLNREVEAVTEGTFVTQFTPSYDLPSNSQLFNPYESGDKLEPESYNPFTYLTVPCPRPSNPGDNKLYRVLQDSALYVEATVYFRENIGGIDCVKQPGSPVTNITGIAVEFEHYGTRVWHDGSETTKIWSSELANQQPTVHSPNPRIVNPNLQTVEDRAIIRPADDLVSEYSCPVYNKLFNLPSEFHPILFNYDEERFECKLMINETVNLILPYSNLNEDTPYSIIVKGRYLLM